MVNKNNIKLGSYLFEMCAFILINHVKSYHMLKSYNFFSGSLNRT